MMSRKYLHIWCRTSHLECPPGYFDDCSRRCFNPYYGENCQSECHCADDYYCHFAYGCLKTKENTNKQELSKLYIYF